MNKRWNLVVFTVYWISDIFDKLARLVEALRSKPEDRGFDSRLGYWDFLLT